MLRTLRTFTQYDFSYWDSSYGALSTTNRQNIKKVAIEWDFNLQNLSSSSASYLSQLATLLLRSDKQYILQSYVHFQKPNQLYGYRKDLFLKNQGFPWFYLMLQWMISYLNFLMMFLQLGFLRIHLSHANIRADATGISVRMKVEGTANPHTYHSWQLGSEFKTCY